MHALFVVMLYRYTYGLCSHLLCRTKPKSQSLTIVRRCVNGRNRSRLIEEYVSTNDDDRHRQLEPSGTDWQSPHDPLVGMLRPLWATTGLCLCDIMQLIPLCFTVIHQDTTQSLVHALRAESRIIDSQLEGNSNRTHTDRTHHRSSRMLYPFC